MAKNDDTAAELLALRSKADRLRAERDRAAGARDQLLAQLKSEFGVATLAEAKTLLAKLQSKADRDERKFREALADFKASFPQTGKE